LAFSPYRQYGILAILNARGEIMATITQRLGSRVRRLREQKKMSQLDLSQKAHLDLTTVNEIENGNREPMLRTLWKIANALEVPLSKLFD